MPKYGVADYLSGTGVAAAWNARHCNVISVMRKWYEFEPTAGTYSFGNLKTAGDGIAFAHDNNIGLFIRFMAGADSPIGRPNVATTTIPDWLNRTPYSVPRFRTFDNDSGTPDREFWLPVHGNATYLARYLLAVDAWNTWFESNCPGGGATHKVATHILGFSVSAITENGAEEVISPGQRHRYTGGTTTWPVGYGADYNNPQTLSAGIAATGNITNIPSTAAFTVPGLFRISTSASTAYAATDELVYCTSKTATRLNVATNGRGFSGTTAQAHATGKVVRQADQSNTLAVHLGTFNGVTGLYDHSRNNAQAWITADGLATYDDRVTALAALWRQNIIDVVSHLTTVRASWAGGALWGDNLASATAHLNELGVTYRARLHCLTTNLRTDTPVRTAATQAIPTYQAALSAYYTWLKRAQTLGVAIAIQTSGISTIGARHGQEIIDAVETGWQEFGNALEFIETNGGSRFSQDNGALGWDTWKAYGWPGGLRVTGTTDTGPFTVQWAEGANQAQITGTGTGCTVTVTTDINGAAGTAEKQTITLGTFDSTDSFTLTAEGNTTTSFVRGTNCTAAAIETALRSATGDIGHIADMEDYFVSFNGAHPFNVQNRVAAVFAVTEITGAATLSGTGSATIAGTRTRFGQATIAGTGAATIAGVAKRIGRATITGAGSASVAGIRTRTGAASLSGAGSSSTVGRRTRLGAAVIAGTSSSSAQGTHLGLGAGTLTGLGVISSAWGTTYKLGRATLTGVGTSSAVGRLTQRTGATLSGTGGGSFTAAAVTAGAATLTGTGSASGTGRLVRFGRATLTGAGSGGIISEMDDEDFLVDTGLVPADGISGAAMGVVTTSTSSSGAVVLTGHGSLLTFLPVEGAATLSGSSTQREEGQIVPSRWRQDSVIEEWVEWEDLLPPVASLDEEFVESADNRYTADGTRLDDEVFEDADWDQTSTQEWAA